MQRQGRKLEGTLGTLVRQGQACQGRLGRTQGFREGHLGVTQRDTLEKYQGTRKDAVEDIKEARRNTREDTGDSTKEKRGKTCALGTSQQQYPMVKCCYSLFCLFALHQVLQEHQLSPCTWMARGHKYQACFGRHTQLCEGTGQGHSGNQPSFPCWVSCRLFLGD